MIEGGKIVLCKDFEKNIVKDVYSVAVIGRNAEGYYAGVYT